MKISKKKDSLIGLSRKIIFTPAILYLISDSISRLISGEKLTVERHQTCEYII